MIDPLLDAIVKDRKYAPVIDIGGRVVATFCNLAVERYLNEKLGYHDFDGKMADEICAMINQHTEWLPSEAAVAQKAVNEGGVGLAAHPYVNHGHVAIIAPEQPPDLVMRVSGRWAMLCPVLGNVGQKNGYMDSNWAFPTTDTPPSYYIFNGKVKGTQNS